MHLCEDSRKCLSCAANASRRAVHQVSMCLAMSYLLLQKTSKAARTLSTIYNRGIWGRFAYWRSLLEPPVADPQGPATQRLVKDQPKNCAPLALMVEPEMNPASSDARKTTQRAISSGSPSRPTGIWGIMRSFKTFSSIARTISVPI